MNGVRTVTFSVLFTLERLCLVGEERFFFSLVGVEVNIAVAISLFLDLLRLPSSEHLEEDEKTIN